MRMPPMLAVLGLIATTAAAQEPLAGTWTATVAERNGAPAPDLVGHRLSFTNDAFEIAKSDGVLLRAPGHRLRQHRGRVGRRDLGRHLAPR